VFQGAAAAKVNLHLNCMNAFWPEQAVLPDLLSPISLEERKTLLG
jgi:hypothetical protein